MILLRFFKKCLSMVLVRFILYTLITFSLAACLPFIEDHNATLIFREGGIIEWVQFAIVAIACVLFIVLKKESPYPVWNSLCAFLTGIVAIRELDSFLDDHLPWGWELPATFVLIPMIYYIFRHRREFMAQFFKLLHSHEFVLMWCGFIMAIPFAQLVGNGDFLKALMGDDYNRQYKRAIEEVAEILGYLFIGFSVIEGFFEDSKPQISTDSASSTTENE